MIRLTQALVAVLETPRELSAQVINHLAKTYGIEDPGLGPFFLQKVPSLEDYEIDLAFSPLFTPNLQDQAIFAELLGGESVPAGQWPGLVRQIVLRPTQASLTAGEGRTYAMELRAVTVERYVFRLRLDGSIDASMLRSIDPWRAVEDRPVLKAIARRAVWEEEGRRGILTQYLTSEGRTEKPSIGDAVQLLRLVETYQPQGVDDLLARLPVWREGLRSQIESAAQPKFFFNARVQDLHGGGRDRRHTDMARIQAKQEEYDALERLRLALAGA